MFNEDSSCQEHALNDLALKEESRATITSQSMELDPLDWATSPWEHHQQQPQQHHHHHPHHLQHSSHYHHNIIQLERSDDNQLESPQLRGEHEVRIKREPSPFSK